MTQVLNLIQFSKNIVIKILINEKKNHCIKLAYIMKSICMNTKLKS